MSDALDLRELLESWPYDSENDVRIVRAKDGRELLQIRTPLGIEQCEMEGRPDGRRARGMESALAFHLARLAKAKAAGTETGFKLSARECAELFDEGMLYYQRYLRCFQLRRWRQVMADTDRNLRVFDLAKQYAEREEERGYLEKWRPYLLRMNAVAAAMVRVEEHAYVEALELVRATIRRLEALEEMEDETFRYERERSLAALEELAAEIEKSRPLSEIERLERALQRAVERQEFEQAAQLRDRLRGLREPPISS